MTNLKAMTRYPPTKTAQMPPTPPEMSDLSWSADASERPSFSYRFGNVSDLVGGANPDDTDLDHILNNRSRRKRKRKALKDRKRTSRFCEEASWHEAWKNRI